MLSHFSSVQFFATPRMHHQALLFMGFSKQEHWSGLPCPPLGDLPTQESNSSLFRSPVLAGGFFTKVPPYKLLISVTLGMSLVVQWLTPSSAGGVGSVPSWGAKIPHASWPKNQNIILAKKSEDNNRSNIVTKSIKTLKMIHSKKKKKTLKNKTFFLV